MTRRFVTSTDLISGHILPDSPSVNHCKMSSFGQRNHLELIMVNQQNRDLTFLQGLVETDESCSMPSQLGRDIPYMGFNDLHPVAVACRKLSSNFKRWTFSQVVDIGFER